MRQVRHTPPIRKNRSVWSLEVHLAKHGQIWNELTSIWLDCPEKIRCRMLLKSLATSHPGIIYQANFAKIGESNELEQVIRSWILTEKLSNKNHQSSSAFYSKRRYNNNQNYNNSSSQPTEKCQHCGRRNHNLDNCFYKPNWGARSLNDPSRNMVDKTSQGETYFTKDTNQSTKFNQHL